ncbi:Type I restriction-modification system, specificity subunit S [Methanosarcina siciliae HI350]|uniref:Type I restriction-modification system, specificity subunit S n=1 Tax=Methanosarcina siciliae HI350 TaxID=1434119 RepID=A0A0E3LAN7_9EURY|nr:restriction endonuclease subunit S [Methanosarcina siciliae]AKB32341.1 Type I restriction-modification system, specificity subunit S [Methanosarcina siciliae HI350]
MNVLLSIKPIYVNEILAGKKIFEFRKSIFKKKDISKVFIYSSSPVKKIVASFEIARIIADSPQKLWDKCQKYGGISETDFFDYFKNSDIGYAIEITNLNEFSEPINPYKMKKDFRPPQSYCYLPLDYFENKNINSTPKVRNQDMVLFESDNEYFPDLDDNKNSNKRQKQTKLFNENRFQKIPEMSEGLLKNSIVMEEKVGWIEGALSDFGEVVSGGTPKTKVAEYWGEDVSWITPADLSGYSEKYIQKGRKNITQLGLKNSSAKLMPKGSVLFSSRAPIGYVAIAGNELCTNQGFKSLVPNEAVNSDFLYYYFKSIKQLAEKRASGTTFKELSGKVFADLPLCLPPLPEQRAIVSKIEQLFSELDNGIANLKLAQEQLKVYRQAVLKKAFEGELTKKWREQQADLPDAGELLEQIKKEREKDAKVFSRKQKSIKSLTDDELVELPRLPKEWKWVKIGEVLEVFVGSTPSRKESKFWGGKIPWVSSGEVAFCRINSTKECITKLGLDNSSTQVHPIGTVMLGMIGEGKTRGQVAILNIKACHNQNTAAIRINPNYLSEFVYHFFEKNYNENRRIGSGNNQQALNKNIIENMSIPLCSLPEQQAIVQEIETRLSVCDKIEQDIETNLEKAEALRQSILKKAFEGKLLNERELAEVRGAEDWEPAGVLLERIKAERAGNGKK